MKKVASFYTLALFLAAMVFGLFGRAESAEFRALWVDGWHSGMWTQAEIDGMIADAQRGHYNVIIPQIRKKADALYNSTFGGPSGIGEPKPSQISPSSFDPLAYMIQQAHAQGIQVHPWLCTHRAATQTYDWFYTSHNDWLTKNSSGALINSEGYYLDPGVPDGEEYTVNVILDIVRNYDIDGIQWDRIRHPQQDSGYNTIAVNRFVDEYGYYPAYNNGTFSNWRRKQLNDFVARVYAQIMEIKPNVAVAANTFATFSDAYTYRFQDWDAWMSNHWLDINTPMNYTSTNSLFDSRLTDALNRRYGRYVYDGLNLGSNTQANAVTQILHCRSYNQAYGVPWGSQTYSYYYATGSSAGWFDYVSAPGRPYESTDTAPTYPWKTNPTTGIILGRVTDAAHPNDPVYHDWVYNATVTLSYPNRANRTTTTDQTGYYVFTDVEPTPLYSGYTITVTKAGFPTRVYYNQAISAGQVLREDFELGYTTISSSPSTVRAPWTLLSLPLEPVNPDPVSVFSGIDIDAKLIRLERPTGSLVTYDSWQPELFGNVSPDEGYWLRMQTTPTVSYQAWAGTPATHMTHLPRAGWSIIGCPFLTDKVWGDTLVTKGTSTVSMQTAAKQNLWLNSLGLAWDPTTQGLYDIGLEDEWPTSTLIQPWHGYWIQSYTNDLYLIQR